MASTINWGDLNGELLNLILSKVFGKDRLSFSLVSKHWNSVAANSPYRYSPCLMYYYPRTRTWRFYQYNSFFNIAFPDLENAELRCSKYGWLLMSRYDDTLFFFDPSNNRKVELPCKVDELYISLCFFNPPTSPECVVVGIRTVVSTGKVEICTLKNGEDEWERIDLSYTYRFREDFIVSLGGPVLHRGLVYFVSVKGDVLTLDLKQRVLDIHFNCWTDSDDVYDIKEHYLVKVEGEEEEELYGVFVFDDEREVNVFRLSLDMKWDLVEEGIGDKVLYLSNVCSFAVKALSESTENAIYLPVFRDEVLLFYSLSDAKYHSIDGGYMESNAYGLKRVNGAAWLMPMPAQEVVTTISWLRPLLELVDS